MGKRCSEINALKRLFSLGFWMILATLLIWSPPAHAGLLNEVTAPVNEVVETVVPPAPAVTTTPPSLPTSAAASPTNPVASPVRVPPPPSVSMPARQIGETAKNVAETAIGTVTSTDAKIGSEAGIVVEATDSARSSAVGTSAEPARDLSRDLTGNPAKTLAASVPAEDPAAANSSGDAARSGTHPHAGISAIFLRRPTVYIWPAVALTKGLLGTYVSNLGEATMTLLNNYGTGSLRGAAPTPGAIGQAASPSSSSAQPSFASRLGTAALPALLSVVAAAIAALAILAVMRRERGLPLISRRVRWRH